MVVLQGYQADLLKDLDLGKEMSPDAVLDLWHIADLALHATKYIAIGCPIAAMVAMEQHMWLNILGL